MQSELCKIWDLSRVSTQKKGVDCVVHCTVKSRGVESTRLLQQRVPVTPGKLSLLSLLTTPCATLLCLFSTPLFLCHGNLRYFLSSSPSLFFPRTPSLQIVTSFSMCKVILQVKVGHLQTCGLAVD